MYSQRTTHTNGDSVFSPYYIHGRSQIPHQPEFSTEPSYGYGSVANQHVQNETPPNYNEITYLPSTLNDSNEFCQPLYSSPPQHAIYNIYDPKNSTIAGANSFDGQQHNMPVDLDSHHLPMNDKNPTYQPTPQFEDKPFKSGRIPDAKLKIIRAGQELFEDLLKDTAKQTDISEAQVIALWGGKTYRTLSSINLWNNYGSYFVDHRDEEMEATPDINSEGKCSPPREYFGTL